MQVGPDPSYSPDMFGIGGWEMVLIMVVALLVFGPKRLPELARSLGRGLAEFRRASSDLRRSMDLDLDSNPFSTPDPETLPPAQAGSSNSTAEPSSSAATERADAKPDDTGAGDAASSAEAGPPAPAAPSDDEPSSRSGD
jgi:TatA/E family protein of Tat protein translocase